MKRILFFIAFAPLLYIPAELLHSREGRYLGKTGHIDNARKEIIINLDKSKSINISDQVYVRSGKDIIVLQITFPMMTTAKSVVLKDYEKYFTDIKKGMSVYKYEKELIPGDGKSPDPATGSVEKYGDIELVFIGGGIFMMGAAENECRGVNDESCWTEEKKYDEYRHEVEISPFWIGRFEVTQRQYSEIMEVNPSSFAGTGRDLYTLPVERVSWYDAVEFCNRLSDKHGLKQYYIIDRNKKDPNNRSSSDKLKYTVSVAGGDGFRLPTEAEWEYACRAGSTSAFCYGNSLSSSMANFDGNNPYGAVRGDFFEKTAAVGLYKPNSFGLYDMHGNVWEWCYDWYGADYYKISPPKDPEGAVGGSTRIIRGGGWGDDGGSLRSGNRHESAPYVKSHITGFRLARSVR